MERKLVPQVGLHSVFFPMAPPYSLRGILLLLLATLRALLLMLRLRPGVVYATGGYVSVPASVASWVLRIPLVVFLPDAVPGRAVRWLLPLARRVATSTDRPDALLPAHKVVVTGYPVREAFATATRAVGRLRLGLPADAQVLCVFGGSQGARSINEAVIGILPSLLERCYVVHICGEERLAEVNEGLARIEAAHRISSVLRARYVLRPFLDGEAMSAALAAADLVLCRSGASVLGELPAVGTPAVLVPFPDPNVHQEENARYLAGRGAAVLVRDDELGEKLGPLLRELLDDAERLSTMARACRELARPHAARMIADLLLETAR